MITKGIILAGGAGTRLHPVTKVVSKQLLPIYDKPLIYYSLSTLISVGITEILIISTPEDIVSYKKLLGDKINSIKLSYEIQTAPRGIAEAYLIGESFLNNKSSALILGDNLFYGSDIRNFFHCINGPIGDNGTKILAYEVSDPSRYGVVDIHGLYRDSFYKVISIVEKPQFPKTPYAVPGLYVFDNFAAQYAKKLTPSSRNELEITDLIDVYIRENRALAYKLPPEFCWFDAGTHESMLEASTFVAAVQRRTGRAFGCPYRAHINT